MRTLYYHTICPKARLIRILLEEYKLEYELRNEEFWKKRETFLKINVSGDLPVLIEKENNEPVIISGFYAIIEYLKEKYGVHFLFSEEIKENAEIRRLLEWFNVKFYEEVTLPIIQEKIICFYLKQNSPNSQLIRVAKNNLEFHLEYAKFLLENQDWIASNDLSIADLALASHISLLDYLGEINWQYHKTVKNWYMLIKSRPSFKNILNEKISGFHPTELYAELDF
ncbi:MAG: glutathione S-transferase family protein [Sphingobacteriia bacterium]|nr:glutathione S-transferase family protein [Sphingobacteriia bacterium]